MNLYSFNAWIGFILPMRNWTRYIRFANYHIDLSTYEELKPDNANGQRLVHDWFILPMRNWNRHETTGEYVFHAGFILPMRNWNKPKHHNKEVIPWGFILPMRNWNRESLDWNLGNLRRIYLTYEELKPDLDAGAEVKGWGIYLTYEELKPEMLEECLKKHTDLSTYEELKLGMYSGMFVYDGFIYLWGIETRSPPHYLQRFQRIYLTMRNWNNTFIRQTYRRRQDLSTYEELKLSFQYLSLITGYEDLSTYEELKPANVAQGGRSTIMDLSYLWGIETQFETVNKNSGDRIYLTYEELKQLSANPPASLVAIYLTYEELKLIPR